jgi:hypothetical protein
METTSGLWVRAFAALFFVARLLIEWSNGNLGWSIFYAAGAVFFVLTFFRQWRLQRGHTSLAEIDPDTGLPRKD